MRGSTSWTGYRARRASSSAGRGRGVRQRCRGGPAARLSDLPHGGYGGCCKAVGHVRAPCHRHRWRLRCRSGRGEQADRTGAQAEGGLSAQCGAADEQEDRRRVRKLKDGAGRFVGVDSLLPAMQSSLLGFPVVEAEDMSDIAANSLPSRLAASSAATPSWTASACVCWWIRIRTSRS